MASPSASRHGKSRIQDSTQKFIRYFRSASILKAVSYSSARLTIQETVAIIPEIEIVEKYFHARSLEMWSAEMRRHRTLVSRGLSMGLSTVDRLDRLSFTSLDLFMARIQGHVLAKALDAYSTFAERVLDSISRDRDSMLWCVRGPIILTNDRWMNMCSAISNILKLLDCEDVAESNYPWPNLRLIQDSSRRARQIFDKFAVPIEVESLMPYTGELGLEGRGRCGVSAQNISKRRRIHDASSATPA
jgi:hypothetical protein